MEIINKEIYGKLREAEAELERGAAVEGKEVFERLKAAYLDPCRSVAESPRISEKGTDAASPLRSSARPI